MHAGAYRFGIHKGIVGHKKEFFCYGNGQQAHRFGPFRKIVDIDAQDAVDHIIGSNGYVRTLVGHDVTSLRERDSREFALFSSAHSGTWESASFPSRQKRTLWTERPSESCRTFGQPME